jgi:hypothetical protein
MKILLWRSVNSVQLPWWCHNRSIHNLIGLHSNTFRECGIRYGSPLRAVTRVIGQWKSCCGKRLAVNNFPDDAAIGRSIFWSLLHSNPFREFGIHSNFLLRVSDQSYWSMTILLWRSVSSIQLPWWCHNSFNPYFDRIARIKPLFRKLVFIPTLRCGSLRTRVIGQWQSFCGDRLAVYNSRDDATIRRSIFDRIEFKFLSGVWYSLQLSVEGQWPELLVNDNPVVAIG